jgi:transposase-like protein
MPRTRRSFPSDFKAQIVLQLLSGAASQAELCRKHDLKPQLIAHWKATVLDRLPSLFDGDVHASVDQQRIDDLEQLLGQQTLELAILKKASRLLNGPANRNGRS